MKLPSIITVNPLYSIFIIAYFLLKGGYSPSGVYVACAVLFTWKNITNLYFENKYSGIPIKAVVKETYFNVIIGFTAMFSVPYIVSSGMEEGWFRLLVTGVTSVASSAIVLYVWGLTPE